MRRSFNPPPALLPVIAAVLSPIISGSLAAEGGNAGSERAARDVAVAVVDFLYRDTSGEPRDQRREHEARLRDFMAALRSDLAAQGKTVVSLNCDPAPCSVERPSGELLRAARDAGAGILLIGGIQKMSTLIQWAKVEAIDTGTERIVLDRLVTFRGDTDDAWRHAEGFIAGELAGIAQSGVR
jgi:hypothetical protein